MLPLGHLRRRRCCELPSAGGPRCRRHEVFLTLKAPFRPLSASAVYHVVASRLSALGVQSMHFGPHGLRHACATHLVAQGLSLKEIGDHLGHRSAFATRTYARVAPSPALGP
ncbi:MAG: hypothetical protein EOR51_22080 [Mesorhizobium sp.]|nr:MAG: hypothetical protein EOR51_22080 [Mesorhizobium sp.]